MVLQTLAPAGSTIIVLIADDVMVGLQGRMPVPGSVQGVSQSSMMLAADNMGVVVGHSVNSR